jgi:hypothetical protein
MQSLPFPRSRLAPALLLLLAGAAARSPALSYVSIEAGRMLLVNPGTEGDVSPLLVTGGVSLPLVEVGPFRFELGTLLWGTQYEHVEPTDVMVPTQIETAHQVGVLGAWISPLAGVHVALAGGRLELGVAAGPTLNFRFPLYETDVPSGEDATALAAGYRYFFAGRFLFPETRVWIRWYAFEELALSLSVTALYPAFHLWDGGAFLDQLTVAGVVGFDVRLPRARSTPAPEKSPAAE